MKSTLTVLIIFISQLCSAQKILVPYRSGKLFGISDEAGKIVTAPQYDQVKWLGDNWFETSRKTIQKDTLEYDAGKFYYRDTKIKLTGLINNGTIILKDEPFGDYEIVAKKCIVGAFKGGSEGFTKEQSKKYGKERRFISLFNLQGKNLYPENFRRIQKIDTTGISKKDKKTGRYILFVAVDLKDRYSMFVFDADEQKITDWLVKDAFKLQADRHQGGQDQKKIIFKIADKNSSQSTQMVDYSSGSFLIKPIPSANKPSAGSYVTGNGYNGDGSGEERVREVMISDDYSSTVAVPVPERNATLAKPAFNAYHQLIKDSLFFISGHKDRTPVALAAGTKIILTEPRGMNQYDPVIARCNDKFYIIKSNSPGATAYDSLIYFGKYFLAWQTINGQTKAGVINTDDSIVVPMEYDSLYADIKFFNLKDMNPAGKSNYKIVLSEADSKYDQSKAYPYKRSFSNYLTVFKNGKCGVMTIKGETIIPAEYEMIAKNNLQHSRPRQDEFIILKQNNKYGIAILQYSSEKKRTDLYFTLAPVFDHIPGFFYPGYYGVKNYKLFGLYNEQYEFMGYASPKGKLFYKD
jgi:hypothetical protein